MNNSEICALQVIPRGWYYFAGFLCFNKIFFDTPKASDKSIHRVGRAIDVAFEMLIGPINSLLIEKLPEMVIEVDQSVNIFLEDNFERIIVLFGDFIAPA